MAVLSSSMDAMLSLHQSNNSNTGQDFEKRVTKILELADGVHSVVHGKGIKIIRTGKKDEAVQADIRAKFVNKAFDNVELVIDCTNSMRNDRIRAKKFDGLVLNSWNQKLYLHIIVFPSAETFKTKYRNYVDEVYYCEREVMLQANNIGVCGLSLALMEDDLAEFCSKLNKPVYTAKPKTIEELLNISRKVILDNFPQYNETNFKTKYPKYKKP